MLTVELIEKFSNGCFEKAVPRKKKEKEIAKIEMKSGNEC